MSQQEDFLHYYEPVHDELGRFCYALTGNREDARDLAQDCVVIAFRKYDQLENPKVLKYFLFSTASRQHKKWLRKKKFRVSWDEEEINML